MSEIIPLNKVKSMGLTAFMDMFSPRAREKKPICLVTVYGVLNAFDSVDSFLLDSNGDPLDVKSAIKRVMAICEDRLNKGFPISLTYDKRSECLFDLQYYDTGKLRTVSVEAWGVKAIVSRNFDNTKPDQVRIKEFSSRRF